MLQLNFAAVAAVLGAAAAQDSWTNLAGTGASPSARYAHAAALDEANATLYIHGGAKDWSKRFSDLWRFDFKAGEWHEAAPHATEKPVQRQNHVAVWNPKTAELWIHGGFKHTTNERNIKQNLVLSDTWAFDTWAGQWREKASSGGPKARQNHVAAMDPETQTMYVHGGSAVWDYEPMSDLWSLDTKTETWSQLQPEGASQPSARCRHGATYDTSTSALYIFGGSDESFPKGMSELWRYDTQANRWAQIKPLDQWGPTPVSRSRAALTFDRAARALYLHGGRSEGGVLQQDLWRFETEAPEWSEMTSSQGPSARDRHVAVFDATARKLYVHGGAFEVDHADEVVWDSKKVWAFEVDDADMATANTTSTNETTTKTTTTTTSTTGVEKERSCLQVSKAKLQEFRRKLAEKFQAEVEIKVCSS